MKKNTFPGIPNEITFSDEARFQDFISSLKGRHIVIDMGCGHGDFLIEMTQKYPDRFFIGVEIARKRVAKTSARLSKRNISNYAVIHLEGELALSSFFPDETADEIHVNFPDPWLKKKQWKNRIFRPSFLIQAVRVLKKKGKLHFVTDVAEYAEQTAEILSGFPHLKNLYKNLIERNIFESFPTLFYQKMSPLRDIHYICFQKT